MTVCNLVHNMQHFTESIYSILEAKPKLLKQKQTNRLARYVGQTQWETTQFYSAELERSWWQVHST